MAASTRVSSAPVVTTQASKTRATNFTFAGVPGSPTDLSDAGFVFGTAASTPATFGALSNPVTMPLSSTDRVTLDSSLATLAGSTPFATSAMTAGQRLWACYFATLTGLVSGSVPDAVYDLGILLA